MKKRFALNVKKRKEREKNLEKQTKCDPHAFCAYGAHFFLNAAFHI